MNNRYAWWSESGRVKTIVFNLANRKLNANPLYLSELGQLECLMSTCTPTRSLSKLPYYSQRDLHNLENNSTRENSLFPFLLSLLLLRGKPWARKSFTKLPGNWATGSSSKAPRRVSELSLRPPLSPSCNGLGERVAWGGKVSRLSVSCIWTWNIRPSYYKHCGNWRRVSDSWTYLSEIRKTRALKISTRCYSKWITPSVLF